MSILEFINLNKIRRAIIYGFVALIALWIQTMFLSRIRMPAVKPLFLPALLVAIGMFEGGSWGGAFGLAVGAFFSFSVTKDPMLYPILFAVWGFLSGFLSEFFFTKRLFSFLLLSVPALLLTALIQIVPLWVFGSTPFSELLPVVLLQSLFSLPFAFPCYYVIRALSRAELPQYLRKDINS